MLRGWLAMYRLERRRVSCAVSLVENWRARGCFLRLSDAQLFTLADLWIRAYGVAFDLDRVEAGRAERASKAADLAVQAVVSGGKSVLNLDGAPAWAVSKVT